MRCIPIIFLLLLTGSCAFPKRSTAMSPASHVSDALDAPNYAFTFELVGAEIPARNRGNLTWDDQDGLPDAFARVYRDDVMIFETPSIEDSLHPEWHAVLPRNFEVTPTSRLRLEVWDRDSVGADPVGTYRQVGLPPAAVAEETGGESRIVLEGGATLLFALRSPTAFRGVGILEYEVHSDAFVVTRVETHSPAGRSDIRVGDAIVAIGTDPISALGEARGASALSLASDRSTPLRVRRGAVTREVELDRGYVWPTM